LSWVCDKTVSLIWIAIVIMKDLILIAEDIVVNIKLLGSLWHKDKSLHEAPHWLTIVAKFSSHLNHH
jgi:hypothetical protein